jgi:phosphoribosyl 1,2-cyclic phosphate phosphodiesterase
MNYISEEEIKKLYNLEVLIITALRIKKHISHFNLEESLEIIKKLKPKKAYLTHISHKLGFYTDLIKILPENIYPAYDGLKIEI